MRGHILRNAIAGLLLAVMPRVGLKVASANNALPNSVTTPYTLPLTQGNTFQGTTAICFGPDGLIYAWDGMNISRQTGVNVDGFTQFGTVYTQTGPNSWSGYADPGPLAFSQNGASLLIGDGGGSFDPTGASNGLFSTMPASGGAATAVPSSPLPAAPLYYNYSAVAVPGAPSEFLVDIGSSDFSSSAVVLYNAKTGVAQAVIGQSSPSSGDGVSIPGASSSIAVDAAGNFYVGVGAGASQGQINRFSLSALEAAAANGSPLNWSSGQAIPNSAGNNTGAGIFVDARGYLFAGGSGGSFSPAANGITIFAPNGAAKTYLNSTFFGDAQITYNPLNDQIAVQEFEDNNVTIYNAGAFGFYSTWTAGRGLFDGDVGFRGRSQRRGSVGGVRTRPRGSQRHRHSKSGERDD